MPVPTGKGQLIPGSGRDRATRQALVEFRGTLWEAMTDWWFGHTMVDYDWSDPGDASLVDNWTVSQDADYVTTASVDTVKHQILLDGESASLPGEGTSGEQRDIFTIPETGLWGIAHAMTEVIAGEQWNPISWTGLLEVKPQHGLGLRAQEDTKRRAIMGWHDVAIGLPQSVNLGVWSGNLDGSGFQNRQISFGLDLDESYTMTGARRQSNEYIIDVASHGYIVGDMVDAIPGVETTVAVTRASNVVTGTTTEPHNCVPGSFVRILFGTASFAGNYTVLTTPTANTLTWAQSGINESGSCTLWDYTDRRWGRRLTSVTPTELRFADSGPDKTFVMDGTHLVVRVFPYFMEMKLEGTVAFLRCWGRHQTIPDWFDATRAIIADVDRALTVYTVTARERTANVATLTIGAHRIMVGERIFTSSVTGTGYTLGSSSAGRVVLAIGPTTVSYASTGTDEALTAATGTLTQIGTGSATQVRDNPAPRGSGRIAFVGAHIGDADENKCVYGGFFGDNSFYSITPPTLGMAVETETAQAITPVLTGGGITATVNQATETETATATARLKTRTTTQVLEAEAATALTAVKVRVTGQVTETETATAAVKAKLRTATQAVETESATTVVAGRVKPVGQAVETELATGTTANKARSVGQALETEAATATAKAKIRGVGAALEAETATATVRVKARTLGQVTETESAGVIATPDATPVAQATETEIAQAIARGKVKAVGQAAEVEATQAVVRIKTRMAAQVVETEAAQAVLSADVTPVNQAVETETAQPITRGKVKITGQAIETETAVAIVRVKGRVTGQAVEAEMATVTVRRKLRVVAQATETETARLISVQGVARQVVETETAQPITVRKTKAIAQAVETETTLAVRPGHLRTLAPAIELEAAFGIQHSKALLVAAAVELELAGAIVRYILQATPPSGLGTGTPSPAVQPRTSSRHGARLRVSTGRVRVL